MAKLKIKTGDIVEVIAGNYKKKGEHRKVVKVYPAENKIIVEGVNIITKHVKPSTTSPQGGIVKKESPIHVSNVALVDAKTKSITKVGYRFEGEKKVRFSKKTNEIIK